jgi:hypothetical protein
MPAFRLSCSMRGFHSWAASEDVIEQVPILQRWIAGRSSYLAKEEDRGLENVSNIMEGSQFIVHDEEV